MTLSELSDAADEIAELESSVEDATKKIADLWEQCPEHCSSSGYGHYCKLQVGLSELYQALNKFTSDKSKRPRGKIEFLFNNLIESIGGGEFMAEHGGFEQTNGRALNTLQKFPEIVSVILSSYADDDPKKQLAEEIFGKFEDLAEKTFKLMTYLKSQERRCPDEFLDLLLDFVMSWEDTFPDVPCFNKLHFLMRHVVEFIDEYGIYGRVSSESHEAMHAKIGRIKQVLKSMTSTRQRMETFHARASSNLKNGVIESRAVVDKKMSGRKRGRYNISAATKRQDEVDFVDAVVFEEEVVEFKGEEFLDLHSGGRIFAKHESIFLYACTGRAPADWVACLKLCNLLSCARVETAMQAQH